MLKELKICGFKSFGEVKLNFTPMNVLIGANGAGKSNLIEVFRWLKAIENNYLQLYIGKTGGANSLLHYGTSLTKQIEARFAFEIDNICLRYGIQLSQAPLDTLIFTKEYLESALQMQHFGTGHKESIFFGGKFSHNPVNQKLHHDVHQSGVFQFHDTSGTASMRLSCELHNNHSLMNDGGNLAAILYKLQQTQFPYYERIVETIRQIAPFFKNFVLEPLALNPNYIQLHWQSQNTNYQFGPHQLSDGTLRTIALITLLLQPESDLPSLIILDEPELGLHPYAMTIITSLIQRASLHTQIILATQSCTFLDYFDPVDVIIVEQQQGASIFKRLDPEPLTQWLEAYTLSELWEKNVIGGRFCR